MGTENPFVREKKHNQGLIVELARNNPGWPKTKLCATFGIMTGTTRKKAEEYYKDAVDAGVLDSKDEGDRL